MTMPMAMAITMTITMPMVMHTRVHACALPEDARTNYAPTPVLIQAPEQLGSERRCSAPPLAGMPIARKPTSEKVNMAQLRVDELRVELESTACKLVRAKANLKRHYMALTVEVGGERPRT